MNIKNITFKRKYRITKELCTDCEHSQVFYIPQYKDWWWPFWQCYEGMYFCGHWFCRTIDDANKFIAEQRRRDTYKSKFI